MNISKELQFQFFPRSVSITGEIEGIVKCFQRNYEKIRSSKHKLESNQVLSILKSDLEIVHFKVENGKKTRIKLRFLFYSD